MKEENLVNWILTGLGVLLVIWGIFITAKVWQYPIEKALNAIHTQAYISPQKPTAEGFSLQPGNVLTYMLKTRNKTQMVVVKVLNKSNGWYLLEIQGSKVRVRQNGTLFFHQPWMDHLAENFTYVVKTEAGLWRKYVGEHEIRVLKGEKDAFVCVGEVKFNNTILTEIYVVDAKRRILLRYSGLGTTIILIRETKGV